VIPVILSGGSGTRLWPLSRKQFPKQYLPLLSDNTMLQETILRLSGLGDLSEPIIICNEAHRFVVAEQCQQINITNPTILLEPIGRNTAPAIAAAALKAIKQFGENAVLLILSAEHIVENQLAFRQAVSKAVKLAEQGYLVTFGIQPTFPETGYGYIEAVNDAQFLDVANDCFSVKRFVEKPVKEKAEEYFTKGNYFWNSGVFCFTAGTILEQLQQCAPDVLTSAEQSLAAARSKTGDNSQQIQLELETFSKAPDVFIDYVVMEKFDKVAVVSCDIDSWGAVSELKPSDKNKNNVVGEALLHDVSNYYIQNEGRLIGAVGLKDLVIVGTEDALLVADKSGSQDVKEIDTASKRNGHTHHKVYRPWGSYTVLEEGKHFKTKKNTVKPGEQISLQLHHHRSEHWIVINGVVQVTNDDEEFLLNKNESTFILAGHKHRLGNPGLVDLEIIEVQSGKYIDEDDIVRFEDMYGCA